MMSLMIETALQLAVFLALAGIVALLAPTPFRGKWLLLGAALILAHDALLTRFFGAMPPLFPGANWNWTGKLLATLGTLVLAALPVFGLRRAGITIRQAPRAAPAYLVFALLTIGFLAAGFYFGGGRADPETIAFQWTMPGIEEETFYRGLLLLALNEAFPARARILGAPIGWGGILSTVLFGLIHSLLYDADGASFDATAFLLTGGPALILLWLRERTGSVLLPIAAHNVANGASTLF